MSKEELTNEQKIIVLLSRVTFSDEVILEINELLAKELNWFIILQFIVQNKITGLVFYNIEKLGLAPKVNLLVYQVLRFYYLGTKERNKIYIEELSKIRQFFSDNNLHCIPLKGAYLLNRLYTDLGSRSINDLDLLIDRRQLNEVTKKMELLGFVPGDFDRTKKEIIRYSRDKEIVWKLKMNNLPSYVKAYSSTYVDFIAVDFAVTLDLGRDIEAVYEMILNAESDYLTSAHFFIHLCCHLYKEATGAIWIYLDSDLNLIKFCDAREFLLNYMDDAAITEAIEFANKYNLGKSLYFTFTFLKEIYNDGYEDGLLERLVIDDKDFLNYFGNYDFKEKVQWNKSFWQRLFSYSNREVLETQKNFVDTYEKYLNL